MASSAEARADVVIVTDDNPRAEDGDAIVAEIIAGFTDPTRSSCSAIAPGDRPRIGEAGRTTSC